MMDEMVSPLSDHGVERRHYHTRDIQVRGYYRADGLWEIEGHMRDTKTYGFHGSHRGDIAAGEPVHDMWLRITVDDTLLIHGAEAVTEAGPYRVCDQINAAYDQLIGLRVGPGFHRAVKQRLGGKTGCTHLTEMLYPMATVCYQTAYASRNRAREDFGLPREPEPKAGDRRPGHIDACHAMRADGPVVKEVWPQFYEGDD